MVSSHAGQTGRCVQVGVHAIIAVTRLSFGIPRPLLLAVPSHAGVLGLLVGVEPLAMLAVMMMMMTYIALGMGSVWLARVGKNAPPWYKYNPSQTLLTTSPRRKEESPKSLNKPTSTTLRTKVEPNQLMNESIVVHLIISSFIHFIFMLKIFNFNQC